MSDDIRDLADGMALWQEHKPRTIDDWKAVARGFSQEADALRAALADSMRLLDSLIHDGTLTGYQAERATGRILEARQALGVRKPGGKT